MAETLAELGACIVLLDRPGAQFENIQSDLMRQWKVGCSCIECDLESEKERNYAIEEIKSDGKVELLDQ